MLRIQVLEQGIQEGDCLSPSDSIKMHIDLQDNVSEQDRLNNYKHHPGGNLHIWSQNILHDIHFQTTIHYNDIIQLEYHSNPKTSLFQSLAFFYLLCRGSILALSLLIRLEQF